MALEYVQAFVDFLNTACSPWHAVAEAKTQLLAAGFQELSETEAWNLQLGGKYFFTRNMSTIVAFAVGKNFRSGQGFVILGAHTDSPCLRLKPRACVEKAGHLMLNTQPYGGGLWHTWFDRDLGLAGRVIVKQADDLVHKLVRINRPILRIPNLAIHLTTADERASFAPNVQEHCIAMLTDTDSVAVISGPRTSVQSLHHPVLLKMVSDVLSVQPSDILDMEMQLIDTQPSVAAGLFETQYIYSGRLDNLCSSYQCLRAIIDSCNDGGLEEEPCVRVCALFDHEEVGSSSAQGAGSSVMPETLRRVAAFFNDGSEGSYERSLRRSFCVSVDMAHAQHPNYAQKHEPQHAPAMNRGIVIKHNTNQRYATNCVTATLFRELGKLVGSPVQEFCVRSDTGCGSTIGPILSTLTGIRTVDVGTPQLSMHSIRECMGATDAFTGYKHMLSVYRNFAALDSRTHVDSCT